MLLKIYETGVYQVNTYLLMDEDAGEAVLIDYGGESEEILVEISNRNLKLKYVLNTHGHFDHISGEKALQVKYDVPIYVHKNDDALIKMLPAVLMGFGFPPVDPPVITNFVDENTELSIGKNKITVIETPGHTKGCVSYLVDNQLFSGDTLFLESVGRTDLPGGSFEELKSSIKDKLFKLPDDTTVYPGHGDATTIGHEKLYNRFVL